MNDDGARFENHTESDAAVGSIVVFLGPTLRLPEAQSTLDAIYVRPAAQGDILLAAHAFHPHAMVLIDGQFEDRPAVRHKEILWAMAQGIVMIGAASMGALRAAELCDFGMIGIGSIFRWYRRWPLAPDDAVAVHAGPAEIGFPAVTDSLIDLLATFAILMRRGLITAAQRQECAATARAMNFRERSFSRVLQGTGLSPAAIARLKTHYIGRKRLDALAALRAAPRLASMSRPPLGWSWVATNTFVRDLEAGGIDPNLLTNYSQEL
jgi:hypothetical protein